MPVLVHVGSSQLHCMLEDGAVMENQIADLDTQQHGLPCTQYMSSVRAPLGSFPQSNPA